MSTETIVTEPAEQPSRTVAAIEDEVLRLHGRREALLTSGHNSGGTG